MTVINVAGGVTVTLLEGAGVPLGVAGGRFSLDESRAPHVDATLTIPTPDADTLELLDPRTHRRVLVELEATYPGSFIPAKLRELNLGLRSRPRNLGDGTVQLSLASDEQLLVDDVLLAAEPLNMHANQDSLRGLVDDVLARIGAELEAGGDDVSVRTYSDATNPVRNPRCGIDTTDWGHAPFGSPSRQTAGGPAGAATYFRVSHGTSAGAPQLVTYDRAGAPVSAGVEYVQSVWVRSSAAVTVYTDALVYNSAGGQIQDGPDNPVALVANVWTRVKSTWTAPDEAANATLRVVTTTTLPAGSTFDVTGWRLGVAVPGDEADDYYDGDTADTAVYAYAFTAGAHASSSTRTALLDRPPAALQWRPGVNALEFLSPIVQAAGRRLYCDELRRWRLVDGSTFVAAGSLQLTMPGNLHSASDDISRDSDAWFDAALVRYRWIDEDGTTQERIDWHAEPAHSKVQTFDVDAVYPGPGRAAYKVKRAAGRGRTAELTAAADITVNATQVLRATLPDTPSLLGIVRAVEFDLDSWTMTVQSRGLTDLGPDSILAIPDGIRVVDLPGTIVSLDPSSM